MTVGCCSVGLWAFKRFSLPKAEAHDRLRYKKDVEAWKKEPAFGRGSKKDGYHSVSEPNREIGVAERLLGLCCVYDGEDEPTDSGWSGLVPCKWTGPLPAKPCMAEILDTI